MSTVEQEIDELKTKLSEYQQALKDIEVGIKSLKTQNRSAIGAKEKELEDWRAKLEVCQQERNQIKQEIKIKVKDLEQSNLSNTEKQAKIIKLLTEHSQELENLDKLLEEERTQYRSLRDKLIERLCQPCSVCPEKERTKGYLQRKVGYLFGVIGLLIVLFFVFHVWFIRMAWRSKDKKKMCKELKI